MNVADIIPPVTAVPMASMAPAPAPDAMANGKTPKKNARDVMNNRVMAASIDAVMKGAKEGRGIARPLAEARVFPALALSMIKVGEETGQLSAMLTKVAVIYEKSLREAIKRFVGFLEPVMILTMGVMIGFIVVSMLMAIFSITDLPL